MDVMRTAMAGDDYMADFYKSMIRICKLYLKHGVFAKNMRRALRKTRYVFGKGKNKKTKLVSKARRLRFLAALDEDDFLEEIRMTRESFSKIYLLIKDHPRYRKTSMSRMTDVRLQMAVVLKRLGSFGNGVFCGRLARRTGISRESVTEFTSRFISVILETMGTDYLYWPGEYERTKIAERNQEQYGFPNLVGFIDGTQIDLQYAPRYKKNEFYNRSGHYSINTVGVCDDSRKIRYLGTGFLGSSHDMRCLRECNLFLETARFISGEQYVLGDGGYKPFHFLVPVSKKPPRKPMPKCNEKFNQYIAMMRIKIEHAFGILKERFQSLKLLPTRINNKKALKKATDWILVCIILNNFLIEQTDDTITRRMKEEWDRREDQEIRKIAAEGVPDNSGNNGSADSSRIPVLESGKEKYKRIRQTVLEYNGKAHLIDAEDDDADFDEEE